MLTRPIPTSARMGFWGVIAVAIVGAALLPMAQGRALRVPDPAFEADLPNGVTVELLGVCDWPDGGRRCWKADGSDLPAERYATKPNAPPLAGRYGLMLRITGPDGLDVSWSDIEGASNWQGSCDVVDSRGRLLKDGTAVISNMEADRLQTSLRIGVAAGAWKTISGHDGRNSASRSAVLWSQAREGADGTEIITSTEPHKGQAERIVAVDLDGVIHAGWYGFISSGSVRQCTARFRGLRISQIKEFQFQTRPYTWVQFSNISLQPGHRTGATFAMDALANVPAQDTADVSVRLLSGRNLSELAKMLLIYANDNGDRFPDDLMDPDWSEARDLSLSWVQANVVYLGRGVTVRDEPDRPLAFDKTLLAQGEGTNVLYLDSHVEFDRPILLEELGIQSGPIDRSVTLDRLRKLALAALLYANEDGANRLPDSIHAARQYLGDEATVVWLQINAEYLGLGMRTTERQPARRPIAYIKTGPIATEGTSVVFLDGHVEFTRPDGLWALGIDISQDRDVSTADSAQTVARIQSATRLSDLWRPLIFYSSEHGERLPDDLAEVRQDVRSMYSWLLENVTYMGRGLTMQEDPSTCVLAYDKALLSKGVGTNVLYLNGRVEFETADRLGRLGIDISGERAISFRMLSGLGKAMVIYANDYEDRFPADLSDLDRVEMHPDMVSWLQDNVAYLGRGVTIRDRPDRPLAYDKTLDDEGGGTNVLYWDGHVVFESAERMDEINVTLFSTPTPEDQARSNANLSSLGIALQVYVVDHGALPDVLSALREYLGADLLEWILNNVTYLGAGPSDRDTVSRPIAYDKTLIEGGNGTNVLFGDGHVAFRHVDQLAELGIGRDPQSPLASRPISARKLADLGKALLLYAREHADSYPDDLDQMGSYLSAADIAWLKANAVYSGEGKTERMRPDTVMAYDFTLLQAGEGTNVLYLDCHVAFETPERLEQIGIDSRVQVMTRLRELALAANLYAHENDGAFPDGLEMVQRYVGTPSAFAWMQANTEYVGQGLTTRIQNPSRKPLAYWKTGRLETAGTAVAFVDGHVEFVLPERFAELGLAAASAAPDGLEGLWITFLPRSPIRDLNEYHHVVHINARSISLPADAPVPELEIRRAANQARVARVSLPDTRGLTAETRRRIGDLPDGEYFMALCYGNTRYSNVARVRLDSRYDPSAEPTLSLIPLPASPGGTASMLLGIRAVGPSPIDPDLTNQAVAFPLLVVDGIERRLTQIVWTGPVGPVQPGRQQVRILRLSEYEPAIEPGRAHAARARVGRHESALVQIPAADVLGAQWDEATKTLAPYEPPRAVLQGKVVGPDGLAGSGYEVCLSGGNGELIREVADEDGSYDFVNVPAGRYQLICNPKGMGQPCVMIDSVTVEADRPRVLNVSLEGRYRLMGRVTRSDGSAVAAMDVALTCEDPDRSEEFHNFTRTDEEGRFELAGPYSQVTYVGVNGRRTRGSMPQLSTSPTRLTLVLGEDGRAAIQ